VAGSNTLVLPTGNGTADQALVTDGSGTLSFADRSRMVLETAKASTSGTEVDFTDIPSWVKKITVLFDGVSLNTGSTTSFLIQLGDSGGIETTNYNGGGSRITATAVAAATFTAGFGFNNNTAATLYSGTITISNLTGNTWAASGSIGGSATDFMCLTSGSKTLSATLTEVRITTVNGTDTFDAGSINLLLEG
jgi:hypothetical protein